jgi:nucleoside phosphorylase
LPKTPVLITAATRWEAEPLARGLGLSAAGPARWEGSVGGRRVVLVKTGVGAIKTTDLLARDFVAGDFGLALSAGLCGAMRDDVRVGDVVADAAGVEMDYVVPLRETAKALDLPFHFGRILHTNVVLQPDMKRRLGLEQRALACDMETAAVRRWAEGRIPTIGARVVLDEVGEALPSDVPEGEDAASLARYALAHAGSIPSLIGTGLRSGRAMKTLARYLKAYLEAI